MLLISNSTVNLLATTSKIMNTEWFQTFKRAKNLDLRLLLKSCVDWRAETLKPLRSHIHACLVESVSKYFIYVNKRWVCLTIKQYWRETFHFQRCRAQFQFQLMLDFIYRSLETFFGKPTNGQPTFAHVSSSHSFVINCRVFSVTSIQNEGVTVIYGFMIIHPHIHVKDGYCGKALVWDKYH